jgi:4-hydroxy-3-polyprenylbenzoate decarboxylase
MSHSVQKEQHVIVGITGASGSIYATRLIKALKELPSGACNVTVVRTESGHKVADFEKQSVIWNMADTVENDENIFAPSASGSRNCLGMVMVPCSMGTLGKVANGIGSGLVCRTADVQLKERRPLIVVPREFPLHSIHLDNMKKLSDLGAIILPASPHFYHDPQTVEEMVDTVVARILDQLGLEHQLGKRWRESTKRETPT